MKCLYVSYSGLDTYMKCPRMYYWRYVERLEKFIFFLPYFVGKVVHYGIYLLYKKDKDAIKDTLEYMNTALKSVRSKYRLSLNDEDELGELGFIVEGMLNAYGKKYKLVIRNTTLEGNEVKFEYDVDDGIKLVGSIDNIVLNGKDGKDKKRYLHELKTTKFITIDYVSSIKTDFQTALYFYVYNDLVDKSKRLSGIVYDVIRKPSIRQKKSESKGEFLSRLSSWYDGSGDADNKFYVDVSSSPILSRDEVLNTISRVSTRLSKSKNMLSYYQNPEWCFSGYRACEFYELCHNGGKTKENMLMYREREKN